MMEQVPALGGTAKSEVFSKHLNALHAPRQAMKELGCQQSSLDPALFYFIMDGQLLIPAEQTAFRELVGHINWAVQGSRPDMAFGMVEMSTESQGGTLTDLNRAMKAIHKSEVEGRGCKGCFS